MADLIGQLRDLRSTRTAALTAWRRTEDALIRQLRREGWSYARVANELGVTKARAQQLVKRAENT